MSSADRLVEAPVAEESPRFWAVIPAAGIGQRMQADRPKQYLNIGDRCLLEHTLARLVEHPGIRAVVVALAADDPYWPELALSRHPKVQAVQGGSERADSVLQALEWLVQHSEARPRDWVLVHDAARPNLDPGDLERLMSGLCEDSVGGILAVRARDTLKEVGADGRIRATLDRSVVWQAYTPQMFRLETLHKALYSALEAGYLVTDEASAIEWLGLAPRVIEGRADNLKVTCPEDLDWMRCRLQADDV